MGNSATRFLFVLVFVLTIACSVAITLLVTKGPAPEERTEIGSGVSAEDVEKTVAKFLKDNPYVIVQAFQAAKQAEADNARKGSEKEIASRASEISDDPNSPYTGNKDADVTIVGFSDYNCGFCKRVVPDLITLLKEDKNLKFVSKDFPILGPTSTTNAKAALAVFKLNPDKWFAFHKAMLKKTPRNDEQILALAAKVGVDVDALKIEMVKPEYQKQIQKNLALGSAIGVRGTPAFVINGEFIRGAVGLEIFKERVAAARARKNG